VIFLVKCFCMRTIWTWRCWNERAGRFSPLVSSRYDNDIEPLLIEGRYAMIRHSVAVAHLSIKLIFVAPLSFGMVQIIIQILGYDTDASCCAWCIWHLLYTSDCHCSRPLRQIQELLYGDTVVYNGSCIYSSNGRLVNH
jgi:hypothetical protein